jgi:hypothetical protein
VRDVLFILFLCPICNKYTVHGPRLALDGRWLVDHQLIERLFWDRKIITLSLYPCKVSAVDLTDSERFTRTVIRV